MRVCMSWPERKRVRTEGAETSLRAREHLSWCMSSELLHVAGPWT
jgi:hypothetical protein